MRFSHCLSWVNITFYYDLLSWWRLHHFEKYENQGRSRGGGSGIPVYPKKIRQNTQKYPKFIQIYPKLYPGILYTWNSKKVIYRIPIFKLILKAPVYCIPQNPGRPWKIKLLSKAFILRNVSRLVCSFFCKLNKAFPLLV